MLEETLQKIIVESVNTFYPKLILVASLNGISLKGLSIKQRAILIADMKKQGLVTGESDTMVLLPEGKSLHIELKVGKNKQSEDQIKYEKKLKSLGHNYYIAKSSAEYFDIINTHLDLEYRQQAYEELLATYVEGKKFLVLDKNATRTLVEEVLKKQYALE